MIKPFRKARAKHLELGKRGEDSACSLLKAKGFEILMRNYRCKRGEIDIIARDGSIICFVEVKTRSAANHSRPAKGLTTKQQERIYKASKRYLREMDHPNVVSRYDLIELRFNTVDLIEARHWPAHFVAPQNKFFFNDQVVVT